MPEEPTLPDLLDRWSAEVRDHRRRNAGSSRPAPRRPAPRRPSWAAIGHLVASLRPVERIGWFRDLEQDWYQAWREVDTGGAWSEGDDDG